MKRFLSFSILIFFLSLKSLSQIQIVQVKRNIPLSDDEPVFKDYYISGGVKDGLRLNLVVPVTRWVNLRENSQAQDQSMKILEPVGWLKIIFVQDHLAVARLYQVSDYFNSPILEQPGILMGDVISLEHSFMSKSSNKPPKDSLQVIEPAAVKLTPKDNSNANVKVDTTNSLINDNSQLNRSVSSSPLVPVTSVAPIDNTKVISNSTIVSPIEAPKILNSPPTPSPIESSKIIDNSKMTN